MTVNLESIATVLTNTFGHDLEARVLLSNLTLSHALEDCVSHKEDLEGCHPPFINPLATMGSIDETCDDLQNFACRIEISECFIEKTNCRGGYNMKSSTN